MNGLELSERFYIEYGIPMLQNEFSHLESVVAVGLIGSGSECFGYDDEISRDHDFEPGFCIFVSDSVSDSELFNLDRAYRRLPREFMGFKRTVDAPVGGSRHGVFRIGDFFSGKVGTPDGHLQLREWFLVPEQGLAEATNGKIFRDDSGEVSAIRDRLSYYPEDVRLKKLAGNLLVMGQSGQYNYPRCISRGDTAAAQLAVNEFVKSALNVIFLINKKYCPYYKWVFRALKDLPILSELYSDLEYLISSPNDEEIARKKKTIIEKICDEINLELRKEKLTDFGGNETEGHAYSVNNKIKDGNIRNLHILYGV
jgi:hypothetical protein